ncbi:MAG TPA: hypothetical protein PK175_09760 [Syntrophales bacterium]|nr:hypothetical protein [Syntrophales bacterium]HON23082.1 hypothetical protein [Syntrophales bacterium]HOU77433.1 hypothetical protein [Syntrophales bacterium]HPC33587.1 hypothetical protein [Syntrophales bacterium]HQG35145.1 hypothetical protein [Syntrophales bacterium]
MDQFINSAEIIANLDAHTFITGHEAGIVDRATFRQELKKFVEIIEQR